MLSETDAYAMLPVDDMEKAKKFYEKTLGLKASDEGGGGIAYKTVKTHVFVYESKFAGTNKGTAVTWDVKDIKTVVDDLSGKDVKFEHYEWPGVEYDGPIHVMEGMKAAWFKDPAGNILGLNQT